MLDILYELLFLTAESIRAKKASQDYSSLRAMEPLAANFTICSWVMKNTNEKQISEKCSHCLSLMLQLFGYSISNNPTL